MNELKVGDVVVLKSGSPKMTVKQFLEDSNIECSWFDQKHGMQKDVFHKDMLTEYKPPRGPRYRVI